MQQNNIEKEINKLIGKINQDGLTIVPTKMYFYKGKAKVQIAVAKGKKLFDKANEPKFKYFIDNDDHMMRYDQELLNEIKKFILNI